MNPDTEPTQRRNVSVAQPVARYGGAVAVLAIMTLIVLDWRCGLELDTTEWVQIAAAAATLVLASAAGSLALDGREHASLLKRHIAESEKLAVEAARHADEAPRLARSNQALAEETVKLAQAAMDGLVVSREMLAVTRREVELRELAMLAKATPDGSVKVSQTVGTTGASLIVKYQQGDIVVEDMWISLQAGSVHRVHRLVAKRGEPDALTTKWIELGQEKLGMALVQLACRAPGSPWIYREITVTFAPGVREGTNSHYGEWIRETPEWSWIQSSSGMPNQARGFL